MSAPSARHWEQNKEATVYVGNLPENFTNNLLWELMGQFGRVRHVNMPTDRVNGKHQGFGFVEYWTEEDAEYAPKASAGIRLHGQLVRVNKASADKQKNVEVGAELFVGNLDNMVDEKALYDTFSRFGQLVSPPKVARDEHNLSKGYGFISYADFDASDAAIASMHGQYIMNKQISVQYAYKKDGKGERHGDDAERTLAKQAKAHGVAPAVQPLPAHLFQPVQNAPIPPGPQAMHDGRNAPGVPGAPNGPAGFGARPPVPGSLPPPPSGLPARPPSGAPGNFFPPPASFGNPPPTGFGNAPPTGYGNAPPAGFAPPGFGPPPPGYPSR